MRINNNLMAMNTHRQLGTAGANGAKSMEKLSSGFRINKAGDDAAGLSISEKMRGQIRGLSQASRNAQDSISLIQTAEGALSETQAILQRMRELAVQSSSDTNVDTLDREAIDNEFKQLKLEIDRISNDTEFNTQKLLQGGTVTGAVTVAHTVEGTDTVKGQSTIKIDVNFAEGDRIEINGKSYKAVAADATPAEGEFKVGADSSATATNLLAAIKAADDTVDASSSATTDTITLIQASAAADTTPFEAVVRADFNATFQIGANQGQTMGVSIGDMRAEALGINDVSLATGADARLAQTTINDAINKVSTQRSGLGAYQNRLEHTIKNLDNSSENLQAAESRVRDVDMAKEMMELTKNNILQQAAQAMLAQANQAPEGVLQLLR